MATGRKTGGRKKGTPNAAATRRRELVQRSIRQALEEGHMPLDIMRCRMLDIPWNGRKVSDDQFYAACQMAPYVHAKLSAIVTKGVTPLPSTPGAIEDAITALLKKGQAVIDAENDDGRLIEGIAGSECE